MTPADPPRILLVEDDAALRGFLIDHLSADGFAPLAAESVADGLRLLEYKQPDLAVIDLGLPDGSGLELIARVRAADGIASRLDPAIPLVVLTGRAAEIDRVRGFERGADDYVVKPFSYGELRGSVSGSSFQVGRRV
jgi:DNA-binding response OmpR family regulator